MSLNVYAPKWKSFSQAVGLMGSIVKSGSRDPKVRGMALTLLKGTTSMFPVDELSRLFMFVRDSVRYTDDPFGEDLYQTPSLTLENRSGDCDDKVILLAALARSVGFNVRLAFVFTGPPSMTERHEAEFPEHVYCEVDVSKGMGLPRWVACETIPVPRSSGGFGYCSLGETCPLGTVEFSELG